MKYIRMVGRLGLLLALFAVLGGCETTGDGSVSEILGEDVASDSTSEADLSGEISLGDVVVTDTAPILDSVNPSDISETGDETTEDAPMTDTSVPDAGGETDVVACVPDCAEKVCGDDGCGGSCGPCADGETCDAGTCSACSCENKECGDDGCGNECGPCPGIAPYCYDHKCQLECLPSCDGKECGDDGCGGSCGQCPNAQDVCNEGLCECISDCADKQCGDDGCGGSCGSCEGDMTCTDGVCAACSCDGKECGEDGCGNECGPCPVVAPYCYDHKCAFNCIPDCSGKLCGDDGCGGSCGSCTGPQDACIEGACQCVPACAEGDACGDDGCGGSCGTCGEGTTCEVGQCLPCSCGGKECGDDGCGNDCGACPGIAPYCYDNQCSINCISDCAGKACGDDGCGGSCGACADPTPWCSDFQCTDVCPPSCDGKACGDDGCGGSCGSCGEGTVCADNIQQCVPCTCEGKECGDDGCGNVCGTCPEVAPMCSQNMCVPYVQNNCEGLECTGATTDAALCALELCYGPEVILGTNVKTTTGANINGAWDAIGHLGDSSNDLAPIAGASYLALASGYVVSAEHQDHLAGDQGGSDPYSADLSTIHDSVEFVVTLVAPDGATGISVDYIFMSQEYEEWIGTSFNDRFYVVLNAPQTTGGVDQVINYTLCSDPNAYFDFQQDGQKYCYIAINTAFSEPCANPTTDISGSGMDCASGGSSTGWLKTTWPINPGEVFTLTFHIHDTADQAYDSMVLIDNFQWEGGIVTGGTDG
jgi:hypothetical protein